MKIRFLPIFLLILGFSQLGAVKRGEDTSRIVVKVLNKSGYDLSQVSLLRSKVLKVGAKMATVNVDGEDYKVPTVLPGRPHGATLKNIKLGASKSVKSKMKRFDVSSLKVVFKGRSSRGRNVTKKLRIGRLKLDCRYWSGNLKTGIKRSYASRDIKELLIIVYDDHVEVSIISYFQK